MSGSRSRTSSFRKVQKSAPFRSPERSRCHQAAQRRFFLKTARICAVFNEIDHLFHPSDGRPELFLEAHADSHTHDTARPHSEQTSMALAACALCQCCRCHSCRPIRSLRCHHRRRHLRRHCCHHRHAPRQVVACCCRACAGRSCTRRSRALANVATWQRGQVAICRSSSTARAKVTGSLPTNPMELSRSGPVTQVRDARIKDFSHFFENYLPTQKWGKSGTAPGTPCMPRKA